MTDGSGKTVIVPGEKIRAHWCSTCKNGLFIITSKGKDVIKIRCKKGHSVSRVIKP